MITNTITVMNDNIASIDLLVLLWDILNLMFIVLIISTNEMKVKDNMKIKLCHSDYLYMVSATRYLKIRQYQCWHSRYRRAEMTALWEMMMGEPARDMSAVTISGTVSAVSAFWIPAGKLILLCQVDSDQVKQKVEWPVTMGQCEQTWAGPWHQCYSVAGRYYIDI